MHPRFEFTPQRLKIWAEMKARGVPQKDIARDLGCSPCTMTRYLRTIGKVNEAKRRGGLAGMAKRYGHTSEASP